MVWRHFVPRQSVPGHISSQDKMSPAGTLCGPIWHNFAVHKGNISSQGTFHPNDISCKEKNRPGSGIFGIKLKLLASNGNFWQEMAMFGWFLIVFHAFGVVFDGIAYICTNIIYYATNISTKIFHQQQEKGQKYNIPFA